jgi:hypothetical protein
MAQPGPGATLVVPSRKGGGMTVSTRPRPAPPSAPGRSPTAVPAATEGGLVTDVLGHALFWAAWAAVTVSAEAWYWWAAVPLAGWAATLAQALRLRRFARFADS